jgi:hypothetical protein
MDKDCLYAYIHTYTHTHTYINYLFIRYVFFIFANLLLRNSELVFLTRGEFLPSISHLKFLQSIMPVKCTPHVCIILLPLCTKNVNEYKPLFLEYICLILFQNLTAFMRLNFRTHLEANGPSESRGPR